MYRRLKDDLPAADSDLNVGDIIVGINETAVSDMEALQQCIKLHKGRNEGYASAQST